MYAHPAFKSDEEKAWRFVEARGFGAIIAIDAGRPIASNVPFLVKRHAGGARLECHVARANPLHEVLARAPAVLVTVWGPDAYVSPDWYVSRDQVPTWNYVSVHLSGTARIVDKAAAGAHVEELSQKFESWLAPKRPWSTGKMPPELLDRMLRAIVPIEIGIETIEASWKLGQHKTIADQYEVARMLEWRGDWSGQAMAQVMKGHFADRTLRSRKAAGAVSTVQEGR